MYPEPLGFIFGAHVVLPRDFGLLTVVSKSFGEEWIQPLRVLFLREWKTTTHVQYQYSLFVGFQVFPKLFYLQSNAISNRVGLRGVF